MSEEVTRTSYTVPDSPYDEFMSKEGVPVHRVLGFEDVREAEMGDWPRLGARGSFVQPLGTEGLWGMYLLEVPGAGVTETERHIYDEVYHVVEGRGSTDVWSNQDGGLFSFEWQSGSLFTIPLNHSHRIVNASKDRAVLLASTTAPPLINLFGAGDFVFDNQAAFAEEFPRPGEYFAHRDEELVEPVRKQPMWASNYFPDLVNCELPTDPSGRRRGHVELKMGGGKHFIWVGEVEPGRYSKAHHHETGPILICLSGQGYTHTWPRDLGETPWVNGRGDEVVRQDYVPGGFVSAAPASGDWFHQHYGVGPKPLRLMRLGGSVNGFNRGIPGRHVVNPNVSIKRGGASIDYEDEDPYIREEFARMMKATGGESHMGGA